MTEARYAEATPQASSPPAPHTPTPQPLAAHARHPRRSRRPGKRQRAVLVGVIAVVTSAPLLIGGGPAWAQLVSVLLIASVVAFAFATGAHGFRAVPLTGLGLLAFAMTAVQLVPLPHAWMQAVSPTAVAARAAAGPNGAAWVPITFDVPATVLEAVKAAAYLGLFVVTAAVARRPRHARLLLLALAFLGGVVAIICLAHRLGGATRIFGLYQPHENAGLGFFAPFVNGNQAAALLVLSAIVAMGVAAQTGGAVRSFVLASMLLSLAVLPLTGARAAFVAALLAATAMGTRLLARRFGWLRATILALALVAAAFVAVIWTSDVLRERLGSNVHTLLDNQKTRGWRDAVSLIRDHVWAGVGRGAFEGPIARYRTHSEGIRLAYPEALPLQIASEWGVPFALMFACAASFAFVRLLPWLKHVDVAAQAAAVGVGAVLLQDLVGFALELTGVAVPVLVAAAVAVGRIEDRRDPDRQAAKRLSKRVLLPAAALSAACAVAALWAQPRTAWVEGERLQRVVASGAPATQALAAAMQRHPTDPYLALLAHIDARAHAPEQAERHLDRARRLFPADGTVDQAAARWMVQRGLPAQAALAYRSAAEHGMVTDPAELYRNVGVSLMAEAVPQTQQALWAVARFMLDAGHVEAAIHASARAVDAAADKTHAALDRLHLASRSGSEAFVRDAAEDVMLAADTPAGFVVAADALDRATQKREAIDAITRGLRRHPSAAPLVIKGAALHLAYDELDAANALLRLPAVRHFEVPDQIRVQELLATLADRRGDLVGAVTARARARVLSAAGGDRTRRR